MISFAVLSGREVQRMVAHAPRIKANELDVAKHLLLESWKQQKESEDLDKYHWINNEGSFNADIIEAIAREVWD